MANLFSDLLHLIAYQISKAVTKDIRDKCSQIITKSTHHYLSVQGYTWKKQC